MKKQKYRFSFTRVHSVRIKYNTGVLANGEYYGTYEYNSTEHITPAVIGDTEFTLSDELLGHAIGYAIYDSGSLTTYDDFLIVNENNRTFQVSDAESIVFFWNSKNFEPTPSIFFQYETKYVHPAFSKLSIDQSRSFDNMCAGLMLNSDMIFMGGAFDYITGLSANYALVFKIERYDYNNNSYYTIFTSLPFTIANCSLDYDKRQLTVDFTSCTYKAYLDARLNKVVNLAKGGYRHSTIDFNIPAMLQVYVDGSETITNIVGGSATEVDIAYIETPEDFAEAAMASSIIYPNEKTSWVTDNIRTLFLWSKGFWLAGRISEIHIVGGNYIEPGSSIITSPAGYYYATTSDNQLSQVYQPTSTITRFYSDTTDFYIELNTTTRYVYIKKVADDSVVYQTTQPVNTTCMISPDSIATGNGVLFRNVNDQYDTCGVDFHLTHNVFCRILTTKEVLPESGMPYTLKLLDEDFAYSGPAYKYAVAYPHLYTTELFSSLFNGHMEDVHLFQPIPYQYSYLNFKCSSAVQQTDSGLGAKDPNTYYTYKNKQGSYISQHFIPIGQYFWSEVSFYATLPTNFIDIIAPWYNLVKQHHFMTVGTAIIKLLQETAPNIKFAETSEYSKILYGQDILTPVNNSSVSRPNIFLTHVSNIQAGVFTYEAQRVEITLRKVLDMLRDAFQIYYYLDNRGCLHLEHISWFYGVGKSNNVQYNTLALKDEYTKVLIDYGHGKIEANNDYLYSSITMTADSEDALELFKPLNIKCLDESCVALDSKEVMLTDFKTDIDYLYASASERTDGLALILPSSGKILSTPRLSYTQKNRCDIKGLNESGYTLWPTNYLASSYELLQYYRWNFASLVVDHCSFEPILQARYFEQEIQVPVDIDIDMIKFIQTRFGDGFIMSYKIDLDSRYATIKLLHVNEY